MPKLSKILLVVLLFILIIILIFGYIFKKKVVSYFMSLDRVQFEGEVFSWAGARWGSEVVFQK